MFIWRTLFRYNIDYKINFIRLVYTIDHRPSTAHQMVVYKIYYWAIRQSQWNKFCFLIYTIVQKDYKIITRVIPRTQRPHSTSSANKINRELYQPTTNNVPKELIKSSRLVLLSHLRSKEYEMFTFTSPPYIRIPDLMCMNGE